MHVFRCDGRAASQMVICAGVTQTGRIGYIVDGFGWFVGGCGWFWVVLAGSVV